MVGDWVRSDSNRRLAAWKKRLMINAPVLTARTRWEIMIDGATYPRLVLGRWVPPLALVVLRQASST